MSKNILLSVASKRVHSYIGESDDLMGRHSQAMECRDCEDFLKHGIDTFKWLHSAEKFLREADYQGISEFDREVQESLKRLYIEWLRPCEFAEKWIASLEKRGLRPDNLKLFRDTCDQVRDIVQRRDWQNRATHARVLSTAKEDW